MNMSNGNEIMENLIAGAYFELQCAKNLSDFHDYGLSR